MWVTPEQIEKAKAVDLLSYLERYEPDNLVRIGQNNYCTGEHNSLKISNGLWHWFSRNVGGKNALDYLMKVRGFSFVEAVDLLSDGMTIGLYNPVRKRAVKELEIPLLCTETYKSEHYLRSRGISQSVIDYCLRNRLLAEDAKYHNCIFFGYDKDKPKYGAVRGTASDFKRELSGSDKRFSFFIAANAETDTVHLFESAIDLMSYATLELRSHRNWRKDDLLSLAGVYKTERGQDVPLALERYLGTHPGTKRLCLHLDNDEIGKTAAEQIAAALKDRYSVVNTPPLCGKDVNDELQSKIREERNEQGR